MKNINWIDDVQNEKILHTVQEERNILCAIKSWNANWIGYILHRNCLLKHIIVGTIEGERRCGRTCKQLLDDLKVKRRYRNFKEEALDCTACISHFARAYGPVARLTT